MPYISVWLCLAGHKSGVSLYCKQNVNKMFLSLEEEVFSPRVAKRLREFFRLKEFPTLYYYKAVPLRKIRSKLRTRKTLFFFFHFIAHFLAMAQPVGLLMDSYFHNNGSARQLLCGYGLFYALGSKGLEF